MVIRLFDDAPTAASIQQVELVTCPDCKGAGEVTVPGSETRTADGVWDRDTEPCTPCMGYGAVPETCARACSSCIDTTFWVDRACAEHDHLCPGCHPTGCPEWADTADTNPWPLGGAA